MFERIRGEPAHHAHIAGVDDDALGPALHAEGGVEDEVVGEQGVLTGADGGAPLRLRLACERGVVHLEKDCLMRYFSKMLTKIGQILVLYQRPRLVFEFCGGISDF